MKYTAQETEYIEKDIRRREKNKKHWLWLRWLMLFASILIMAAAAYNFYILHKLQETISSVLSMPKKEYNSEMVKLFIEGNLTNLRLEFIFLSKIAYEEILGLGLLIYCLANWNRHIKEAIVIKVLQDLIFKERQN